MLPYRAVFRRPRPARQGAGPNTRRVRSRTVELSARNQLRGNVKSIKVDGIMAEVVVDVGGQEVVAAITRTSVERLGIKEGDQVHAVIKATEVMIGR